MIYLFKTHYSPNGRSIIQVNEHDPKKESQVLNLADLCLKYNIKQCFVVDDSLSGIWPIFNTLEKVGVSLVFGYKVNFVSDGNDKSDNSNISAHKNILFARNEEGYKALIKAATKAQVDFFHNGPRLDYNYLHQVYNENLVLAIPFYDSFLFNNSMSSRQCVPDFRSIKPTFFVEDNELPFDAPLRRSVETFATNMGSEIVEAQTVLYETRDDILAYQARRLMNRSQGKANTIEKPNLNHFGSDTFCLKR